MVKYDKGFKLKVVHAYLACEGGYASLATRFGVPSKANKRKWISAFQEFGEQGLVTKKANAIYPVPFKLDVLNYKERTRDSFKEVARKFDIPEPIFINWWRKLQTEGVEGLSKSKGRPSMSNNPKNKKYEKKLSTEQQLLK